MQTARARRGVIAPVLLVASLAASCSGGAPKFAGNISLTVTAPDRCDPLGGRACLLPFPSDTFTVPDRSSPTGVRVHLDALSMPANKAGVHIDPTRWNENDGFSPGEPITTYVPGIDVTRTGLADAGNISPSLAAGAPIVLLDATTGRRLPYWAELDATATSDADRLLIVRPAVNFLEGHRIVVAMRHLVDHTGRAVAPEEAFRAYRDRLKTDIAAIEGRRPRYERVFADLGRAGVRRADLFLAWDFTIASEQSLAGPLLHMRDAAFQHLGPAAPRFTVSKVEPGSGGIARTVSGTFDVPLFLTSGAPGSTFAFGPDGLPAIQGTLAAKFRCLVPEAALAKPARPAVYGHGLLGSVAEVDAGNVHRMAAEHNFVFCATNWLGFSTDDIPTAVKVLGELSLFPEMIDRADQGILDALFLGRLMIHANGLVSDPAFQSGGHPVIDTGALYYDGNSQGGIMGGAATAVSVDWTRAVLGVTGMNYSTLLQRSSDWTLYAGIYNPAYPDPIDRIVGISLIQMLWDRADANGYAQHMTDNPLPGTPRHTVLLDVALGDHQVSTYAAEVEARTVGAALHWPATAPGRLADADPHWGLPHISTSTYAGSAIVWWDSGSPAPPLVNLPPTAGLDPHEHPRNDGAARLQKSDFLTPDGALVDVCAGAPCRDQPVG